MCEALGLGVEPPRMYKTLLSPPPHLPPPTGGIILGLINWTWQNDPWLTHCPPTLLVYCRIMKDGNHQFLTHNSERLVIKLNWKTFIQSPSKIFQSVVRNVECRDRLEGMDTVSFGNLQKSPEYFRRCSKVVEIFFGNADKMHTKVSLLWLRKREQFSVVLFAFLETRREFYRRRNLTRDCYRGHAGQLLANIFLCP